MWSLPHLLTRSRTARKPGVRLSLESLADRCTPSSLLDPGTTEPPPPPANDSSTVAAPPTDTLPPPGNSNDSEMIAVPGNAPPQIVNFMATCTVGGSWQFSGDVVDEAPGGLTVRLGGELQHLQGVSTTTDASGHFSVAVFLNADGTDDGLATAQTADGAGLQSNVAEYQVVGG